MALKSSSTGSISGASSLTIAHTVPAGTNRVMIVLAAGLNSADPLAAATVAYGGVSLGSPVASASEALPTPSANNSTYAWVLANPAVGAANVVITCAAGGYVDAIVCTIDDAPSATPVAKAVRSSAFESSPAVLAIAGTSRQVVDLICNRALSKTMTPAGAQTRIGTAIAGGASSTTGSYASNVTTMDWTHPDGGTANISRVILAFDGGGGGSPPTLTSPTGTKTGSTTASGTVTTTETGGTLYYRATTNASESAATVKAGSSTTVDALNESVSLTGLTPATTYRNHYLHAGANGDSAVVSSSTFTTDAAADTERPTMNGDITVGTVASTSIQISWLAASDNSGGTLTYETSVDGGAFTDRGSSLSYNFTGLSASASYTLRVRAKDPSGNVALTPLQVTQSTAAGGSGASVDLSQVGTHTLKNKQGAVFANTPVKLSFQRADTDAFVVAKNLTTSAAGLCGVVFDAALASGVAYDVKFTIVATGAKGLFPGAVAA